MRLDQVWIPEGTDIERLSYRASDSVVGNLSSRSG